MLHSPPIRLTAGVHELLEGYSLPEVGVFVSFDHPDLRSELLDAGLASEVSSPWWRSKSTAFVLAPDISAGTFRSIIHNVRGMLRTIIALGIFAGLAVAFENIGVLGVCLATASFLLSILLHEAGHVLAFRVLAPQRHAVLVSAGLRCHMVRPILSGWREVLVVLAGPLAPLLPIFPIFLCVGEASFLFWSWSAIAFGHVLSLIIPIGDGANLRLAFRHLQDC